jgi:alkanesulfonate monooxygenase SsuD/methylene tetrahydromethanopterin reductase-like flavin-dependent oxidoreductase (luciferase family)
MKLGVLTMQDTPWPELVARWRRLDELGVETIWIADHLGGGWIKPGQPWFEAWCCLTALAHVTRRPRIGSLVSPMTYRNPAVLARAALTVAELSGGRLELGVGSGGARADHELAQVEQWAPTTRAGLFVGWVERLRELLAAEAAGPADDCRP